MKANVTKHAAKRMKERAGIPKKALKRNAELALECGYKHSQVKGGLKRWMDGIFLGNRRANNMRVYGNKLYIFNNSTLITVFNIPTRFANHISNYVKESRR